MGAGKIEPQVLDQAVETATYMKYDWRHRAADGSIVVRAVG